MTENIIHLVLARIDGASAGTKGLSLFIVPKIRVQGDGSLGGSNDVSVVSIEHKLGINGSSTCTLNFGDNDECIGTLVGVVEHQGMKHMFSIMNFARIAVGVQGMSLAGAAYVNTLKHARERKQGASYKQWKDPSALRTSILSHPNIRRDLLDMKSKVEGMRALIAKLTTHIDYERIFQHKDKEKAAYHKGQVDLLTPLVKAYASDEAFRICETSLQIHGGAGYVKDLPIEQYLRDSKIFSIYEGTNAIQALDLVGRKLGLAAGQHTMAFLGDIQKFIDKHAVDEHKKDMSDFEKGLVYLQKGHEALKACTGQFLAWFQSRAMENIILNAEVFLNMMAKLTIGWLLLEATAIAQEKLKERVNPADKAFYEGKKYSGIYFSNCVLPDIIGDSEKLREGHQSPMKISDDAFGPLS